MQLLKKRTFNENFTDTFGFIKENGRHFFKNYFILSSVPIALFVIIAYFFTQSFMSLNSFRTGTSGVMESYLSDNIAILIVLLVIVFIVSVIFSIIQYTYTPIYMHLYHQKGTDFTYKEILTTMFKEKLSKIIIYFLFSLVISIPVFIVFGLATLILLITIVGVLLPFIVASLWYSMSLFAYLKDEKSVLESFQYAWKLIFRGFWKNVGAVAIFTIIIIFISFGISMIMNMFSTIATLAIQTDSASTAFIIIALITSSITQIVSIFLQLLMQVMNGIIFYGMVEQLENKTGLEEIEKIGLGE